MNEADLLTKPLAEVLVHATELLTAAYEAGEETGSIDWADLDAAYAVANAAKGRLDAGESVEPQKLTLAEYTAAIQGIEDAKVAGINADKKNGKSLFGAMAVKWTESQASFYYERGFSPEMAHASSEADAIAEARAEAAGS